MAPTPKQVTFFTELVERKRFPDNSPPRADLLTQFGTLTRQAASEWIDKAMTLPNATDGPDEGATAPAPF